MTVAFAMLLGNVRTPFMGTLFIGTLGSPILGYRYGSAAIECNQLWFVGNNFNYLTAAIV